MDNPRRLMTPQSRSAPASARSDYEAALWNRTTRYIARLTDETITRRVLLQKGYTMPIEIKGLKNKALKARANLDALSAAYDKFNEAAPAHAADVAGLTEQVGSMQSDLEFAANVMGNSNAKSDEESDKGEKQIINGKDVSKDVSFLKPGAGNGADTAGGEKTP